MKEYEVKKITFLNFTRLIFGMYKYFVFYICIITLILNFFNHFQNVIQNMEILNVLFGFVFSIIVHEYSHVFFFKRYGIQRIKISNDLLKFSVSTNERLVGRYLIITAISGPLICGIIGSVLLLISIILNSFSLKFLSIIYLFQLLNLIPFFGDGKMILKGIFTLNTN